MSSQVLAPFAGLALAALALACGSSAASPGTGAAGAAGSTSSGGAGGAGSECPAGPGYHADSAPVVLASVSARISDAQGSPVANLPVQVCGLDLCINGQTDGQGRAAVSLGMPETLPAFKYGTGFDASAGFEFAKFAVPLGATSTQDLGNITAVRLPDFAEGVPITTGEIQMGPVALEVASGTKVLHDLLTYTEDIELRFRSAEIPPDGSVPAVPASLGLSAAYALGPVGTRLCPPAGLSIENTLQWPPGTEVEFFLHGVEIDEEWAPYGGWAKIADGAVNAAGTRLESATGGLPILSAIGVRPK
jgi:hypothetical protein